MRICGLLDAQDATLGLDLTSPAGGHLRWCDVVVATPAAAGTLYATEASYFDDLRVVVVSLLLSFRFLLFSLSFSSILDVFLILLPQYLFPYCWYFAFIFSSFSSLLCSLSILFSI